jgi:uncharacterized LabA/DUF88 family protein
MKTVVLIDGFNVYHPLDEDKRYHKYKWLNLEALADAFVMKKDQLDKLYYFTSIAYWSKTKQKKHLDYIKALKTVSKKIEIVLGKFKKRDVKCRICGEWFKKHEEKQTDVNIAIMLLKLAITNSFDKAIIVSADSDLVPAIKATKEVFPEKQIGVLFPFNSEMTYELKEASDFHSFITKKHLKGCLLDKTIQSENNNILVCPTEWN